MTPIDEPTHLPSLWSQLSFHFHWLNHLTDPVHLHSSLAGLSFVPTRARPALRGSSFPALWLQPNTSASRQWPITGQCGSHLIPVLTHSPPACSCSAQMLQNLQGTTNLRNLQGSIRVKGGTQVRALWVIPGPLLSLSEP